MRVSKTSSSEEYKSKKIPAKTQKEGHASLIIGDLDDYKLVNVSDNKFKPDDFKK